MEELIEWEKPWTACPGWTRGSQWNVLTFSKVTPMYTTNFSTMTLKHKGALSDDRSINRNQEFIPLYFRTLPFYISSNTILFLNTFIRLRSMLNVIQRIFHCNRSVVFEPNFRDFYIESLKYFSISCKNWTILGNKSYFSSQAQGEKEF